MNNVLVHVYLNIAWHILMLKYTKILFVVYLESKFNWMSCMVLGNLKLGCFNNLHLEFNKWIKFTTKIHLKYFPMGGLLACRVVFWGLGAGFSGSLPFS